MIAPPHPHLMHVVDFFVLFDALCDDPGTEVSSCHPAALFSLLLHPAAPKMSVVSAPHPTQPNPTFPSPGWVTFPTCHIKVRSSVPVLFAQVCALSLCLGWPCCGWLVVIAWHFQGVDWVVQF